MAACGMADGIQMTAVHNRIGSGIRLRALASLGELVS